MSAVRTRIRILVGSAVIALMVPVMSVGVSMETEAPVAGGPEDADVRIEVLDIEGQPVDQLSAEALEFFLEGDRVSAQDVGTVGGNWRVVLYFDQLLSDPMVLRNATIQLGERAIDLTRLGPVEIVMAGLEIRTALPATRDPDTLSQALGWLRLRESSEDLQTVVREDLLQALEGKEVTAEASDVEVSDIVELLEGAFIDESLALRDHREMLLSWAVETASPGPKVLFYIGGGFDPGPGEFFRTRVDPSMILEMGDSLSARPIAPSVDELSQTLSIYGWNVFPFHPPTRGDVLLEPGEDTPQPQEGADKVDVIIQDGRLIDKTTIGFDPAELLKKRREKKEALGSAPPVLLDPEASLRSMAITTGGEVVSSQLQLSSLLERLPRRHVIAIDSESASTGPKRLEARLQSSGDKQSPGTIRVRQWVSGQTPEIVASVRLRRYLENEIDEGGLPVTAAVQPRDTAVGARILVQVEASPEAAAGPEPLALRVSTAVVEEDGSVGIEHQLFEMARPPTTTDGAFDERVVSLEVAIPELPDGPVVVLVEELATGRWGGSFASEMEATGSTVISTHADALILPAPKLIHLLAPAQILGMGQTTFEVVISESEVARVDFYLDGEREAVRRSPPFRAVLDLGPLPQPRRVEVVAFGSSDKELGRDYLIVNEGSGTFGVRIVKPRPDLEPGSTRKIVGPLDVEVEVEPHRGEGIDRVEFYWKEQLVATRYAPPFRQRLMIPDGAPPGFVRAVAYLEDGASSEDVIFVNSPGPSERLQVNLMELYVVVTDRRGQPVRGLKRENFQVTEEDKPQEIATFGEAGELPLTVGLAIDSSASMFVKLPEVQFAAAEFLRGLATRRDRAFVVGFGSEPRLARTTTSDLPEVVRSLGNLVPNGKTAIWKAIVYSLVQLQGVPGKKALVVYSDGADEDPDFDFRTCLRFARKVGVPIYIVVSNNEIVRTEGKGLSVRGFLGRLETLTASVGGRVFMARVGEDLEAVYQQIEDELRSQYLVGYYSQDLGGTEWRQVEVDVSQPGLKARTIAGYFR